MEILFIILRLRNKFCFCLRIKPKILMICVFTLFAITSIFIAVLSVYFTSPKSKTCQPSFKRIGKSSFISTSQPRSVAVGDFNNDNRMDFVVANSGTDNIGIFISYDDDTYTDQKMYSTGLNSRPYSIVIDDLNNDHYLDIAVTNYGTNNIGIFLGYGNGTFANQTTISTESSRPVFIIAGDFNNDNRSDIAVANNGTNSVSIFLGYGNGSFQVQRTYFTGYDSLPNSMVVADFDNDTHLDIAIANYGTNNIGILLGYGNGSFKQQQTYTTDANSNPCSLAIGDFNKDNVLDIIVANFGSGNIGIFLGYGNGSFASQKTYSLDSKARPHFIAVGHFVINNQSDIVIVDSINNQIHILLGSDNDSLVLLTTYDSVSASRPFYAAVADLDEDNRSDIIIVNYDTSNVLILNGYSIYPSTRQTDYFFGYEPHPGFVAVGDINNDKHIDIITGGVKDGVCILIGYSNGTFVRERTYSTGNQSRPQMASIIDLNNDNHMDIVTPNVGSDNVGVLFGLGNGTFADVKTYSTGINSGPRFVAVGDMNNDDRLDIVSANSDTNTIGILLAYGNDIFANVTTISTGTASYPISVAIGDIDNDNHLDIVVATLFDNFINIFFGYGNGKFQSGDSYYTGYLSGPTSVALFDFNHDNYLDIVMANQRSDEVRIFIADGNGSFAKQIIIPIEIGSQPYTVIIADFDNDHHDDIAVTLSGMGAILIFYGYGNGTFKRSRVYSTGSDSTPLGIAVADFNNDTHLEIVVALWGTGTISVLVEYNSARFANQTIYSTNSAPQPYSLAVGNFNNDNRSDIVVANSGTDNLGILLGLGNGSFEKPKIYFINRDSYPRHVIATDINKDDQLDFIAVNSKINTISIFNGYANGTFTESILFTGYNSYPSAVVAGDLNNDDRLDLVNANEGTASINIFFGFNYTSFAHQMTYSNLNEQFPVSIIVNDFNNDKHLDIAVAFQTTHNITVIFGYGNGSFGNEQSYSIGIHSAPAALVADDINHDGRLDMIVATGGTDTITILFGCENGRFADMMNISTGNLSGPYGIAVTDFNHDNHLDIAVANFYANNVGVLLGYGNGSFAKMTSYSTGDGSSPVAITVSDFNNDNHLDIAVVNFDTWNIGILLGLGNGSFAVQVTYSTGYLSYPYSIDADDFNGDSQIDIVTANKNTNNVGFFFGYGNGTFADMVVYSTGKGSRPVHVRVGDFNNDNISDVAVTLYGNNNVIILFGFGDGTLLTGWAFSTDFGSGLQGLAFGDFNNDTLLDMVVNNFVSSKIDVFLGYGSVPFSWGYSLIIPSGLHPHSLAVGHFHSDNQLDIVVADYGADNIAIILLYDNGHNYRIMTILVDTGSAPYSVVIGDFNNDNRSDIVVTNSGTDKIAVILGYGNGTFATAVYYSTGDLSRPYTIATGDFDNDGKLDIVIANSGTNNILVLYGDGNGAFGHNESYALGYDYRPYSLAVADLNQDGSMEIIIACYGSDNIEILMKMC